MTNHYVDKTAPNLGYYRFELNENGARWVWTEMAKGVTHEDDGPWVGSLAEAYRNAADDWESNGNSANRRLAGQLRAAATRAEKATS